MSTSFVCILHSGGGYLTEKQVGNALQCLQAVQRSVRATAPDFIPSIAVYFADPHRGARCVYSSAVPDYNHALDRVAATYPPLTDASGALFSSDGSSGEDSSQAAKTTAFAQLFRLRSPLFLQQAVLRAAQEQNSAVPTSGKDADRQGFKAHTSPTSAAASPLPDQSDSWGSLAGALLAALCYLRAHPSSSFTSIATEEESTGIASATDDVAAGEPDEPKPLPRSAGKILVFSDAQTGSAAPSYSAECALAMATIAASKMGVVVSCFGEAVADTDSAENRLMAMAASLGGFCAPRFSLRDLGLVLDGVRGTELSGGVRSREKRDRIASQYVVGPTMLPRRVPPSLSSSAKAAEQNGATEEKAGEAEQSTDATGCERASHLGWLCPSCMAIIFRSHSEHTAASAAPSSSTAAGSGEVEVLTGPTCPYCALNSL